MFSIKLGYILVYEFEFVKRWRIKKMKFQRRLDLSGEDRLRIALEVLLEGPYNWGCISGLAAKYKISRQFIYNLRNRLLSPFAVEQQGKPDLDHDGKFVQKLLLCSLLYGHSSIEGSSRTLDALGLGPSSIGSISGCLAATAAAVAESCCIPARPLTVMADEIFVNGKPVLVVAEAVSHFVIAAQLSGGRDGDEWKELFKELKRCGYNITLVAKDQGTGLQAGCASFGVEGQADLFHLLKPFDVFLPRLERQAYAALERMYHGQEARYRKNSSRTRQAFKLHNTKAVKVAASAIRFYDNFHYLHDCMHEIFDSFTQAGELRTKATARIELEACLALMEEEFAKHQSILDAVKFIRRNVEDFWGYFERLEVILAHFGKTIPKQLLQSLCLAWQLGRKAMAVKDYRLSKQLAKRAAEQKLLSLNALPEKLRSEAEKLFAELEANIRSSSPLEAINSQLRDFFDGCRGQFSQDTLKLLVFFLNHKKARRGKYAGSSPYERFSGKMEAADPIDLILDMKAEYENMQESQHIFDEELWRRVS